MAPETSAPDRAPLTLVHRVAQSIRANGWRTVAQAGARNLRHAIRREGRRSRVFLPMAAPADQLADAIEGAGDVIPVIDVPLERLRWSELGLRLDGANPFVETTRLCIAAGHSALDRSPLHEHYRTFQPCCAAEALGLDPAGCSPLLKRDAPSGVAPWAPRAGNPYSLDAGNPHLGPMDHAKRAEVVRFAGPQPESYVQQELERYRVVTRSIVANGFVPEMGGYIRVQILADGTDWVAKMYAGAHRVAALAALGIDPVRVAAFARPTVVRRNQVGDWPGVRSGMFTEAEALAVFDRILDGRPPWG